MRDGVVAECRAAAVGVRRLPVVETVQYVRGSVALKERALRFKGRERVATIPDRATVSRLDRNATVFWELISELANDLPIDL
jgi:hypothetical protein